MSNEKLELVLETLRDIPKKKDERRIREKLIKEIEKYSIKQQIRAMAECDFLDGVYNREQLERSADCITEQLCEIERKLDRIMSHTMFRDV